MTVKEYNKAVDEFADGIFRFAMKHLRNEMSANDIVQETFTKVWEKRDSVDGNKVKSYLFTNAYHAISERTKTPVEFRTSKASKNKQGGFLLKIGKFEVSRKTHK